MLDPFKPEKKDEIVRLKAIQKGIHENFKNFVTERRSDKIIGKKIFTGEVWEAARAKELGLIDGIGHLETIMEAEELVAKLKSFGIAAFCIKANLLKDNEITSLIEETTQTIGKPINLLVNNASIFENDSLLSLTLESWDRHFFTNLKAPVFLSKEFSKQVPDHFKDENNEIIASSNIINIIDQKVLNLNPRFFSYTLAKSSLLNFTKIAAQELGPKIRVNAIGPGPVLKASHQSEEQFQNQRKSRFEDRCSS